MTVDFESHRAHLYALAYRMLGSASDAEDAVQETWLRLSQSDISKVENPGGWLTIVLSRECLHMLRSRRARPVELLEGDQPSSAPDPEQTALLADSVGTAMLVVLDQLTPAERVAFVLHDIFAVSFDEIAGIVGRTPAAARQLASRARHRVNAAAIALPDIARQRRAVQAFLAASRDGDFEALIALLDPDAHARAGHIHVRGAQSVAKQALSFSHLASHAQLALIDGAIGIAVVQSGHLSTVLTFSIADERIAQIVVITDPARLPARHDIDLLQ